MTANQRDVLLALNLRQMQMADGLELCETGVYTDEVAKAACRSNRSTAVVLSQMRDFGWVASCHGSERIGWLLQSKGVSALEREANA